MTERRYTIQLEPRGKGRPVFTRATGHARTPATTRAWEHEAAFQLREAHGDVPAIDVEWPLVEVEVTAYHAAPKARPKWCDARRWRTFRAGEDITLPAATRHDLDNVVKIVLDAMQIGGVLTNDRCVVSIAAASFYAFGGMRPCVEVTVREVKP